MQRESNNLFAPFSADSEALPAVSEALPATFDTHPAFSEVFSLGIPNFNETLRF